MIWRGFFAHVVAHFVCVVTPYWRSRCIAIVNW